MKGFVIGLIIGALLGGIAGFFFFTDVRRGAQTPGTPIKPPDASGQPPATAQLVLKQDFFNEVLATIFRDMNKPAFDLSQMQNSGETNRPEYAVFQQPCDGKINILPEGSGVQTGVSFENNRITAPLAFTGSYRSPFGCFPLNGWARANLELRYDNSQQMVFGQLNVDTVNLDGVDPFVNAFATPLVQSTLNTRVNPIRILDAKQLAVDLPLTSTNGRLQATITDVRAEVKDNALNLFVSYAFTGAPLS